MHFLFHFLLYDNIRTSTVFHKINGHNTVEPQFNGPLYNKVLGISNNILQPGFLKCMEQNLDITNRFPLSLGTSLN